MFFRWLRTLKLKLILMDVQHMMDPTALRDHEVQVAADPHSMADFMNCKEEKMMTMNC